MKKYLSKTLRLLGWALIIGSVSAIVWLGVPPRFPALPFSTVLLDRSGAEIGELVRDRSVRHRPTDLARVPVFFREAVVAIEDRWYDRHLGVSLRGLARSAYANAVAGRTVQGASTIPSQYVRTTLWINEARSPIRKLAEFVLAFRLSLHESKDEILRRYLDALSFGRLAVGPESAARVWFGRPLGALTPAEQLALVTIAKNPARYDPIAAEKTFRARFEALAERLVALGVIDATRRDAMLAERLAFRTAPLSDRFPYVRDFYARSPTDGARLVTTIDATMTDAVKAAADRALADLAWKNVSDYAIVVVDRATMELRVMIGGENYARSDAGQVNAALAPRQPGSVVKPFTYLLARERLGLRPDDAILDLPVAYRTAEGYPYEPKNYSLEFGGVVSVGEALAQSINVPAVKVAEDVGVPTLYGFLRSVGISTLTEGPEHYGLALTLGDAEMSLYELVRAYSVFAKGGKYCDIATFPDATLSCRRIVSAVAVADIEHVLSNRYYKLAQYPLHSALDFEDRFVFWKTGTSRNFRDNWTVGYTDHYLLGVWSGNKSGENMRGVSGATGAGEIFGDVVRLLEPAGAARDEPARPTAPTDAYLAITSPLPESTYALDPGRRPQDQALRIEYSTNVADTAVRYRLDERPIESSVVPLTLGRHAVKVELIRSGAVVASATTGYVVLDRPPSLVEIR